MNDQLTEKPKGLPLRNKSDFTNRVKRHSSSKDIKIGQLKYYSKLEGENKDCRVKITSPVSNKEIQPIQNNYIDEARKAKPRQRYSILSATNSMLEEKPRLQTAYPNKRVLLRFPTSIDKIPLDALKKLFKARCDDLKLTYVDKQQNRFLEFCTKSIKPTRLCISECGLGVKSSEVISEIIKLNTDFKYLELTNNNISDNGLKIITDALAFNHNLISVDFSLCSISNEGSDYLFDKLSKHPSIIDINLSNNEGLHKNKIGSKGCVKLKEFLLKNQVVNYLNVADNSIGADGLRLISQGLEKTRSLVSLNISNNNLPSNAITFITEGIMSCCLKELVIRKNDLGDKCVMDILDVIYKKTFPLEVLDLSLNQISSTAANLLFQALKTNKCIIKLNLSQNSFAQPLHQLAICLKMNKKLKYLYLSDCSLSEENGEYISEGLSSNNTLTYLTLESNKLSDKGIYSIGLSLKQNKSLKFIDLSTNNIADEGCLGIVEGLKENNTLENLLLKNNKIGNKSACYLMHTIAMNDRLINVNTQLNLFHYKYTEGIEDKIKKNIERKKRENAPKKRMEFNTLKECVINSKAQPYTKQQLKEEKQKEKISLQEQQNVFDGMVTQENQNFQDLINEHEQLTKRAVEIKKEMKEIDYEMDDLDAKMARVYEAKLNEISKMKGENALLEKTVEQERDRVHNSDMRNRYTLEEVEGLLKKVTGKLECSEMMIQERQRMIDKLNREIDPPPVEPPVEIEEMPVETKKKRKKKKKLRKKKVKRCCAGYTPKINIGK